MKIEVLELGAFETNCYVLMSEERGDMCVVIDPGLESEGLVAWLEERGLRPEWVLLTHGHVDHIAGVELVRERWHEVKVAIGREDAGMLGDTGRNLSAMLGATSGKSPCFTANAGTMAASFGTLFCNCSSDVPLLWVVIRPIFSILSRKVSHWPCATN